MQQSFSGFLNSSVSITSKISFAKSTERKQQMKQNMKDEEKKEKKNFRGKKETIQVAAL
jgi:hypothetical protein